MTRFFQLSENCEFGTSKEEQIRDQLIDECRSHDLRKKLLAVSGKLTLQKARDIARFTLLTDHKPLETIYSTSSRNSARLERWVLRLQPYKFRLQYVPGKQNIADSLSRLVDKGGLSCHDDTEEFIRFLTEASAPVAIPIRENEEESATNPEISQLRECISTGDWDKAPPQYKHVRNELSSLGKLVLRGTRLPIPRRLRERVKSRG